MENGQLNAAVAAIKEKGVLSSTRIERSEIGAPGEFDALTDDEPLPCSAHQLRQLGDIGRDPARLVLREQLGRRSGASVTAARRRCARH